MAQNIVVSIFDVESEGYQALTELKQNPGNEQSFIFQAALAKKEDNAVKVLDSFDTGVATTDDMAIGGLIGACMGILGGPIGVLLCGSYGALLGSVLDMGDAIDQASLIEQIANKVLDDKAVIVALTDEEDESVLDERLSKYQATILRYDAAVVAQEVEEARMMEEEMARQARAALRKEKNAEFKGKVEDRREKLKASFADFKASLKKKEKEEAEE